jgi:hypothetical protein
MILLLRPARSRRRLAQVHLLLLSHVNILRLKTTLCRTYSRVWCSSKLFLRGAHTHIAGPSFRQTRKSDTPAYSGYSVYWCRFNSVHSPWEALDTLENLQNTQGCFFRMQKCVLTTVHTTSRHLWVWWFYAGRRADSVDHGQYKKLINGNPKHCNQVSSCITIVHL